MSKNVFQQIADARRTQQQQGRQRNEQQEAEFILSLRNDDTNADEAVVWIRAVMYVLTAFVIYLGFNYYLDTFREMFPPIVAGLFAIALPAVVEIGKIQLLGKGLRSIGFGWLWSTWPNLGYWSLVLALGAGSFWWSYTISTGGIKEVAKQTAIDNNRQDSLHLYVASATADVDRRIADINASNQDAASMKTRRGKIAWSGQTIQMNNSATLLALQQERQQIVDQVTADYKTTAAENKTKVSAWAGFIERFGGWGEWGVLICLVAIAFFERRLYDLNQEAIAQAGKGNNSAPYPNANGQPNGQNHKAFQNVTNPRPIGFHWEGYGQPSPIPSKNTVTQLSQTVTQMNGAENTSYADDTLKLAMKRIQGHFANFDGQHRNNATVAGNIHTILDETLEKMRPTSFVPTYDCTLKFYDYVAGLFPALEVKGWPYDKSGIFLQYVLRPHKSQPLA